VQLLVRVDRRFLRNEPVSWPNLQRARGLLADLKLAVLQLQLLARVQGHNLWGVQLEHRMQQPRQLQYSDREVLVHWLHWHVLYSPRQLWERALPATLKWLWRREALSG